MSASMTVFIITYNVLASVAVVAITLLLVWDAKRQGSMRSSLTEED